MVNLDDVELLTCVNAKPNGVFVAQRTLAPLPLRTENAKSFVGCW